MGFAKKRTVIHWNDIKDKDNTMVFVILKYLLTEKYLHSVAVAIDWNGIHSGKYRNACRDAAMIFSAEGNTLLFKITPMST